MFEDFGHGFVAVVVVAGIVDFEFVYFDGAGVVMASVGINFFGIEGGGHGNDFEDGAGFVDVGDHAVAVNFGADVVFIKSVARFAGFVFSFKNE